MSDALRHPWPDNIQRLRLGDVEFDLRYRSVTRDGRVHELSQRCFDLLLLFLREPRLLHTREEIFRRVWAGVVVEDANITTSIWLLRKALGDDAKGWIRTVAKQGYVFDPPCKLEPAPANDPIGPEPSAPAADAVPDPDIRAARPLWRQWRFGIAVAFVVAAVLAVTAALHAPAHRTRAMILAVPDPSVGSEARWPAELWRDWIEWQLDSRSDRITLAEIAGERDSADVVVLLSAAMPVGRDGDWHLHANLHEDGRNRSLDGSDVADNVIAMVDRLSRDLMQRLVPEVTATELPSLRTLDAAVAPLFVMAVAAEKRGRWNEAVAHYREVLEHSPQFTFARLHLAMTLAELGQSNAAQAELVSVERWVATLPAAMRPLLQARMLAIRQNYTAAAHAFGELYERSEGQRLDLRLAEATNLRRAGRSRDALSRLSGGVPKSPAQALAWLVERSEAELATMDLARSRATAGEAIRLAQKLGWNQERARATLLLMDGLAWSSLPIEDALYEDAIAGFEAVGDKLGTLRAKLLRSIRDAESGTTLPDLDEVLAEARAAGNAAAEIDTLRRVGQLHLRRGETQRASERLHQAEAVADSTGDRFLQRQISVNLLRLDMWRGDLAAASRRLQALRAEPMQGMLAFLVGLAETRVHYRRGEYEAALATVAMTQDLLRVRDTEGGQSTATGLDCAHGSVLVRLGRIADAKTVTDICGSPTLPYYALHAAAAEIELAMLAGDETMAKPSLLSLADTGLQHPSQIDRWSLVAELAPLLSRVGELQRARELVDEAIPPVAKSGFVAIEIDLRIAAAEIAFAQGRIDGARKAIEQIKPLVQPEDWAAQQRLQTLDVLLLRADGKGAEASALLTRLHAQTREHGDVLGELLVHSIAGADLARLCPRDEQLRLLAQSGMRGADLSWLVPPALRATLSTAQP